MDMHPDVYNDGDSFPDGDSPFALQQTNVIYKVIRMLYNKVTDILACFYHNHWLLVPVSLQHWQCLLTGLIAMLSLWCWQCLLARLIAMCTG
jgi:protein-S-isoprenylcysteine O-methyltransferase Ste14